MTKTEKIEIEHAKEVLQIESAEEAPASGSVEEELPAEAPAEPVVSEPVIDAGYPIKSWRDDTVLLILAAVIGLSLAGLLLVILIPAISLLLGTLGLYIPFFSNIASWISSGFNGLIIVAVLGLLIVAATILLRRHVLKNPLYYLDAGCPQCHEHELIRVRRRRADRILAYIGIPAQRRVCRNCSWGGLRLGRLETIGVEVDSAQPVTVEERELPLVEDAAGLSSEMAVGEES